MFEYVTPAGPHAGWSGCPAQNMIRVKLSLARMISVTSESEWHDSVTLFVPSRQVELPPPLRRPLRCVTTELKIDNPSFTLPLAMYLSARAEG